MMLEAPGPQPVPQSPPVLDIQPPPGAVGVPTRVEAEIVGDRIRRRVEWGIWRAAVEEATTQMAAMYKGWAATLRVGNGTSSTGWAWHLTYAATGGGRTAWPDDECTGTVTAEWTDDACTNANYTNANLAWWPPEIQVSPTQKLREILAERRAPRVITGRKAPEVMPKDVREQRARETLRRVIGNDRYRSFLRTGHVSVRGKDGYHYQLFPGHGISCVFDQGKLIARLCVVWPGSFTPTDSLIMRYLVVLNNPAEFWRVAVKHDVESFVRQRHKIVLPDARPLADIYKDIKAGRYVRSGYVKAGVTGTVLQVA
jgi:hypothetical protein